ncbi:MAG TPA: alpha/beta fold hydrolase [Solirubrobacteraceae bacterium]|jgi:pimeloyl-ACP methyl ester carboxylesterase
MADFAIDSGGVTIAGEEAGQGIPVVLLHGLTATRRYVVMGSRTLERGGHRVLLYDARGHGRSGAAPEAGAYGYSDLARDLGAVLDGRGIAKAVLAGASMGAHTLLRFALDHPQRVAGIGVITPAFDPEAEDAGRELERWDRLSDALRSDGVEGFVEAYGVDGVPEKWRDTVQKVLRQRLGAHEDLDAVADALRATPRSRPFEAWEELAALDVPAVVVASRDDADPGHPLATGERYAEAIPGAELRTEDEGASPLAWQGGQLSKVIAALAERAG